MIHRITCYRFSLPFSAPVLVAGGALRERQGMLLAVESNDGQTTWGEASPLPGFSRETLDDVIAVARRFARDICGASIEEAKKQMTDGIIIYPSLRFAFNTALYCSADFQPARQSGETNRDGMVISLCALASGDAAAIHKQVEQALHSGYGTVKIKVGMAGVADDIAMLKAARHTVAGACRFRFDANRAWSFEDAERFCEAAAGDEVDYIEEPLAEPAALNRLSAQSGVPCAVDETLQELSACLFAADENAHLAKEAALRHIVEGAQALIWKPSLCMPPERMALQTDAPVILSSAYESGVGTAAILKMATTPRFRNSATGIDTYSRFADDVLDQRLPVFRGEADMRAVADTSHALNPAKLTQVWHV